MSSVNVRDLRNRGGEVIERVARGASVIVTKGGAAVAELRPIPKQALDRATLLARFKRLPGVDPAELRRDLDRGIDPSGRARREAAARAYEALIAAIALANGLPIYTVNPKDFAGIDDLLVVAIPHPDRK